MCVFGLEVKFYLSLSRFPTLIFPSLLLTTTTLTEKRHRQAHTQTDKKTFGVSLGFCSSKAS